PMYTSDNLVPVRAHCTASLHTLLLSSLPAPPHRPSFPTRRSSDLCLGRNYRAHAEERGEEVPQAPIFFTKAPTCVIGPGEAIERSEEHTSELQARENLVCRLLLEKKKIGAYVAGGQETVNYMSCIA